MNNPDEMYMISNEQIQQIRDINSQFSDDAYFYNYETYFNSVTNVIESIINGHINNIAVPNNNMANNNYLGNVLEEGGVDEPMDILDNDIYEEDIIPPMAHPLCEPLGIDRLINEITHDCSICFLPMELVNLTITRCGHVFHASCLNQALDYNTTCPQCRSQLVE